MRALRPCLIRQFGICFSDQKSFDAAICCGSCDGLGRDFQYFNKLRGGVCKICTHPFAFSFLFVPFQEHACARLTATRLADLRVRKTWDRASTLAFAGHLARSRSVAFDLSMIAGLRPPARGSKIAGRGPAPYADIKGYSDLDEWRSFYAIIYMTEAFYSQKDVEEDFALVKAELSWKLVVVLGKGARIGKVK